MTEKEFLTKCLAEYDEFYTDSRLTRSEFLNEFLEQHHKEYYEVEFVSKEKIQQELCDCAEHIKMRNKY